ncbi:hypothetical protein GBAR_LOCUS14974 [Geodia barretti]|uniref:Uncharacterized protein n=1 Tax=Geodia barretti TaxID=519541 RepID=A0AA35WTI8_GEOBA|nr:hypothetical protein GBAR_LOCUS14974 [Geodia barretti]
MASTTSLSPTAAFPMSSFSLKIWRERMCSGLAGRRATTTTSNLRGQTPISFGSKILKRLTSAPMNAASKMKRSPVVRALLPLRLSLPR